MFVILCLISKLLPALSQSKRLSMLVCCEIAIFQPSCPATRVFWGVRSALRHTLLDLYKFVLHVLHRRVCVLPKPRCVVVQGAPSRAQANNIEVVILFVFVASCVSFQETAVLLHDVFHRGSVSLQFGASCPPTFPQLSSFEIPKYTSDLCVVISVDVFVIIHLGVTVPAIPIEFVSRTRRDAASICMELDVCSFFAVLAIHRVLVHPNRILIAQLRLSSRELQPKRPFSTRFAIMLFSRWKPSLHTEGVQCLRCI